MFEKRTGGPAFPRPGFYPKVNLPHLDDWNQMQSTITQPQDGMTLRDWFAGQALAGAFANDLIGRLHSDRDTEFRARLALMCYDLADSMLVARSLPHDLPSPGSTGNRDRGLPGTPGGAANGGGAS